MSRFIDALNDIRIFTHGGHRAPHKPLLLLLALSEVKAGVRQLSYSTVERRLTRLLQDYGPARTSYRPNYPFWRLQSDGIWQVSSSTPLTPNAAGDVSASALHNSDARGHLVKWVLDELDNTPSIINQAVNILLNSHFPATVQEALIEELNLSSLVSVSDRLARDPNFRIKVLSAYNFSCALCGYRAVLSGSYVGLEAAHIKWHAAGGSNDISNGLALCSTHHRLFDRGAFTLNKGKVEVSPLLDACTTSLFGSINDRVIFAPDKQIYLPSDQNCAWHYREVFKSLTV